MLPYTKEATVGEVLQDVGAGQNRGSAKEQGSAVLMMDVLVLGLTCQVQLVAFQGRP